MGARGRWRLASMWQRGGLTLVSGLHPRVLPWTWFPAVVGESLCGRTHLFTELDLLSGVRAQWPSRSSPTNQHPSPTTYGDNDIQWGPPRG